MAVAKMTFQSTTLCCRMRLIFKMPTTKLKSELNSRPSDHDFFQITLCYTSLCVVTITTNALLINYIDRFFAVFGITGFIKINFVTLLSFSLVCVSCSAFIFHRKVDHNTRGKALLRTPHPESIQYQICNMT